MRFQYYLKGFLIFLVNSATMPAGLEKLFPDNNLQLMVVSGAKGSSVSIIRIYHYCEGGIEKPVLRITDWHHEACRVMTNSDLKGQVFLSHSHTNNGFFFLLTVA